MNSDGEIMSDDSTPYPDGSKKGSYKNRIRYRSPFCFGISMLVKYYSLVEQTCMYLYIYVVYMSFMYCQLFYPCDSLPVLLITFYTFQFLLI